MKFCFELSFLSGNFCYLNSHWNSYKLEYYNIETIDLIRHRLALKDSEVQLKCINKKWFYNREKIGDIGISRLAEIPPLYIKIGWDH